ncbi:MAG TPA: acylglycerol kinase family protein [Sphingomicrobium sp.]|nr:acylglycerol kinase family protein [Sphingomicrobium sp.]
MLKVPSDAEARSPGAQPCPAAGCAGGWHKRIRIALLSNPKSTGNLAQLPRIREYCDSHPDIFHYEVEQASQIGDAMRIIARVRPSVLVINGGDGTVQATLTELYNGGHFDDRPPPVAVLPSGKTNLIALDLGARGDPIATLERLIELARSDDLHRYTVARELIALRRPGTDHRPVIGMFLGGSALAETMLYCRHKIYPLGLPNSVSHGLTALAYIARLLLKLKAGFLPPAPGRTDLVMPERDRISGRFAFLAVTTLNKMLLSGQLGGEGRGPLKVVAIEERASTVFRALLAGLTGGYKGKKMRGIHFEEVDQVTIEGESSQLILDGETFRAESGRPIHLMPAQPLSFVKLAA